MSTYDNLVAAPGPRAGMHDEFRALEDELAERRFVGRAADETVAVTVTGAGVLVDIAIKDAALRGSHPDNVGPAIVTAMREARIEAARYARDRTRQVLHPDALPATVRPVTVPVAPRRGGPVVDDDLFQGFGGGR